NSEVDFNRPYGPIGIDQHVIEVDVGATPTSFNFWFEIAGSNVLQVRIFERVGGTDNLLALYNGTAGIVNSSASIATSSWTGKQLLIIDVESNGGFLNHYWRLVVPTVATMTVPASTVPSSSGNDDDDEPYFSSIFGCAATTATSRTWLFLLILAMLAVSTRLKRSES
ncbi:MAG: hypothetical protein ACYTDT_14215, partial [Planctomycetota bacterium]